MDLHALAVETRGKVDREEVCLLLRDRVHIAACCEAREEGDVRALAHKERVAVEEVLVVLFRQAHVKNILYKRVSLNAISTT